MYEHDVRFDCQNAHFNNRNSIRFNINFNYFFTYDRNKNRNILINLRIKKK